LRRFHSNSSNLTRLKQWSSASQKAAATTFRHINLIKSSLIRPK